MNLPADSVTENALAKWLHDLSSQPELGPLLSPPASERIAAGYGHTLAEICQQPLMWTDTAARVVAARSSLEQCVESAEWLALTGSGSSQYAAECVHPALQVDLAALAITFGGGWLLIEGVRSIPLERPGLLVSLARSGNSPESAAVLELFLDAAPLVRHLVITCNERGRLATRFSSNPRVRVLPLNPLTDDRSLVMTSSFTSMVIAARGLGYIECPSALEATATRLADIARDLLSCHTGTLAGVARGSFKKVVYLASGCRFGAARESALKMLEMNAGLISTMAETYLGLRHGPMCWLDPDTLVVCYLSSDPLTRAYEEDLIGELNAKQLGARKLLAGEQLPLSLLTAGDVAVELPGLAAAGDTNAAVIDAVIGQLLAFFRCLAGGLRPDMPSTGVINRVVNAFAIHDRARRA